MRCRSDKNVSMLSWTYDDFKLLLTIFSSCCSETVQRETLLPPALCVPIILCSLLTDSDLVGEQKWGVLQVAREDRVTVFARKRARRGLMDRKQYAGTGGRELITHRQHFFIHTVTFKV